MFRYQTIFRWILVLVSLVFLVSVLIQHLFVTDNSRSKVEEMSNWRVPGPKTFCPPFSPNLNFNKNIFFIEIPCNRSTCLTPRSVCGIESTARANPHLNITVYILSRKRPFQPKKTAKKHRPGQIVDCEVTRILHQFPNIRILNQDLRLILNKTLGQKLNTLLFGKEGDWTAYHAKEVLKLALLKEFGDVYLDTNVVTFRPFHCLRNTIVYFDRTNAVGNQVLLFEKNHPFLEFALRSLTVEYEPTRRESMGATQLAEAFEVFCNTTNQTEFRPGRSYSCHKNSQVNLIEDEAFFPVDRIHAIKFFETWISPAEAANISARLTKSFLAHVDSASWGLSAPFTSLYASLARVYCPSTWNAVPERPGLEF